jgi:hypothetical protein
VIDDAEPALPIPEFEALNSDAVTNPITIPLDLESASAVKVEPAPFDEPAVLSKPEAPPPQVPARAAAIIPPLGRRASLEVELELEVEAPPPVEEPAPALPAPPAPETAAESPGTAEGSLQSPFERKRAALISEEKPPKRGRMRLLLILGGAALVIVVAAIVMVFAYRGRGDGKSGRAGATQTASAGNDSVVRPGPSMRATGRRPRRVVSAGPSEGSMTAMTRGMTAGGDDPGMAAGGDDPGMTAGGDDPGMTAGGDDPGKERSRLKVQLRLSVEPKRSNAVIHFRGGKYLTNRFVSKKVKPRSTQEVITITARGYKKVELKLTLDQDLEQTVKLKRRARRMKLFDLGSKPKKRRRR